MSGSLIEFRKRLADDDALQIKLRVTDGDYSAAQEFLLRSEDVSDLATRLEQFPRRANDDVRLHLGGRSATWAYTVHVRFWLYDTVGHAAVSIDLSNNARGIDLREARFTIRTEVASLNRMGQQLKHWVSTDQETVRCELASPET